MITADYNSFISGENKGTILAGSGAFVYTVNGIPDTSFICPIEEMACEDESGQVSKDSDGAMYGLESDMLRLNIEYEYPIMNVSENVGYKMVTDLNEPYASQVAKMMLESWSGKKIQDMGPIYQSEYGAVDVDRVREAYFFYNK